MRTMLRMSGMMFACVWIAIGGCATPQGSTAEDKRIHVLAVRDETIRELNRREPQSRRELASSAGYAVFSNVGAQFFVLSSGNGFGVVVDNTDHSRTYMRTAGLGAGLGLGVRDYRMVMIFGDRATLVRFVDKGWDFGAQGEASARLGDSGGTASGAESSNASVKVYQFTENGVMVGGSFRGARFWVDEELNK